MANPKHDARAHRAHQPSQVQAKTGIELHSGSSLNGPGRGSGSRSSPLLPPPLPFPGFSQKLILPWRAAKCLHFPSKQATVNTERRPPKLNL